jgi:hypothetical protein
MGTIYHRRKTSSRGQAKFISHPAKNPAAEWNKTAHTAHF